MKTIFLLFFLFVLSEMALYSLLSQPQGFPGSGMASVAEDSLAVYSANSSKSDIVRVLKKGELVWIQIAITGAEDKWCLISPKGKSESLGYVLCKDLLPLDQEFQKVRLPDRGIDAAIPPYDSGVQPPAHESQGPPPYSPYLGNLLQAVWKEDILALTELLTKGADPNARTAIGASLLHGAAKKDNVEITRTLIAYGADVNARDGNGLTPLMAAASANQTQNIEVLIAAGAHIDVKDNKGFTALMWAVFQRSPQGIKVLLENKAQVNARTKEGRTALWFSKQLQSNIKKSLASAYRENSPQLVRELKTKLANQIAISRMLQSAGGKE